MDVNGRKCSWVRERERKALICFGRLACARDQEGDCVLVERGK